MASRYTNISPQTNFSRFEYVATSSGIQSEWIARALHNVFVRVHDGLVVVRSHTHTPKHMVYIRVRIVKLDFRLFGGRTTGAAIRSDRVFHALSDDFVR